MLQEIENFQIKMSSGQLPGRKTIKIKKRTIQLIIIAKGKFKPAAKLMSESERNFY